MAAVGELEPLGGSERREEALGESEPREQPRADPRMRCASWLLLLAGAALTASWLSPSGLTRPMPQAGAPARSHTPEGALGRQGAFRADEPATSASRPLMHSLPEPTSPLPEADPTPPSSTPPPPEPSPPPPPYPLSPPAPPPAIHPSQFMTSESQVRKFRWTPTIRSAKEAFGDVAQSQNEWEYVEEGTSSRISRASVIHWVEEELLQGPDPFAAHGGMVPVPWPIGESQCNGDGRGCLHGVRDDQLGEGEYVGYSRRQLCYIVARSLLGSTTQGYDNGLHRFLHRQSDWAACSPRTGDFGAAFVSLLAACAADPTLAGGGAGPMLLVGKASRPPPMSILRGEALNRSMATAMLRLCEYDTGAHSMGTVEQVPEEGCSQPSTAMPGRDFMSGGTVRAPGQAVVDISAKFIGGYIFGNVCGLGGGQDERMMVYMPEVTALAFFLSQAAPREGIGERPQLRVPAWVLGARMLFLGLDGTARHDGMMLHDKHLPFARDLQTVMLRGHTYLVDGSRPFIAFMSETQGFLGEPEEEHGEAVRLARRNRHPLQRKAESSIWFAFQYQVRAWYTAVSLSSYHAELRGPLRTMVRSVGSGPWMAGLWWGDSQLAWLASWLGHALAQGSWRFEAAHSLPHLPLDYYVYSAFTENPANQCFLLPHDLCGACIRHCESQPLPESAYWLPSWALLHKGPAKACAGFESDCGHSGLADVFNKYQRRSAKELWEDVERVLDASSTTPGSTIFDKLLSL